MILDKNRVQRRKETKRRYYLKHRDQIRASRNTEHGKELRRQYAKRRKHVIEAYRKQYYEANAVKIKAKVNKWYYDNPERVKQYREVQKPKRRASDNKRRESDLHYRIKMNLRTRLYSVLFQQKTPKRWSVMTLIGCSIDSFKTYIESKFQTGMSWDNYGEWELDHIIPCALFDLSNEDHQRRCFHFSNYQPLWEKDNQQKHTRLFHNREEHLPI